MKKLFSLIICFEILSSIAVYGEASALTVGAPIPDNLISAKSSILMEAATGEILQEFNSSEKLPIASVTKTMTMLLIMEALESGKITLTDMVPTSEHAASMGGSQVFLEVGEQMPVGDMLKAIAVASGNDASAAMAEFISGSEPAFVELMNKRAGELGAANTHFLNCNGLNESAEHYSSAYDVALISRELLRHPQIFDYTTIWMDSLRGGAFGLANTNKLIRFYSGANGLKTGSTDAARYCLSATAKRENMQLIAVILGAPTTDDRFEGAKKLLDYGFANFSLVDESVMAAPLPDVTVTGGIVNKVAVSVPDISFLVPKGAQNKIDIDIKMVSEVKAPVKAGDKAGEIIFTSAGAEVAKRDILTKVDVGRITLDKMLVKMMIGWLKY